MLKLPLRLTRRVREVRSVLAREVNLDALSSLASAMHFQLEDVPLSGSVIAFDTNAFLRLAGHRRCDDIVDSLRTSFEGRLILPGQVIQEFWNGQTVMLSVADNVKNKFVELEKAIRDVDERFNLYSGDFNDLSSRFKEEFGYIFDENTLRRTSLFIDLLMEKALVPYIPRSSFSEIALTRKRTKTPPGFKDDLEGDFFVWSDLLYGLATLKADGFAARRVILVTLEKKPDWGRDGIPHPILSSEIKAICGGSFQLLTIEGLAARLLD